MSIYLNAITGSRELEGSSIDKAITAMAIRLSKYRNSLDTQPAMAIDLTVMLPGKNCTPDFEGMRMTRFSPDEGLLYMESAIPAKMLHSANAEQYLSALLEDAIDNAQEFFVEQGVSFDVEACQAAIYT